MSAEICWITREPPLVPCAVAASGEARVALLRRLLEREDLAGLHGADGDGWIVVTGPEDLLPWADGVIYLGRDLGAQELYLPTTLAPNVPAALFSAAISSRALRHDAIGPYAVLPNVILSLAGTRSIDRAAVLELLK